MSKTQDRLNAFYGIDNLITVDIKMPEDQWASLMACEPRGGICNFEYAGGPRFDWYKASSVTISGTHSPKKSATFKDVGIIKKSYCGSFSKTKPSVRLDFASNVKENEDVVEKLIGTKSITLNNCKQDPTYIRQPLAYELFRHAEIPTPRCNFANMIVNGTDMGVFVNLEQYKKQFLKNNFDGNDEGNLYELDAGDDLDAAVIKAEKISFESGGDEDQKDLLVAAEAIASDGLTGAKKVIDYNAFIKLYAMETIMKHRDGFTVNTNNTYLYNDVRAVDNPTIKDINLKFIPCGTDQLLREVKDFEMGSKAILARLVLDDRKAKADLLSAIRTFATTIFSKSNHDKVVKPYIDRLEALVACAGAMPEAAINSLRHEVKLVRSGAYQHLGEIPTDGTVFVARISGVCIPTSNSEYIPEPTASTFGRDLFKTGYFTLKCKATGKYVTFGAEKEVIQVEETAQAAQFYLY
ncbi:uncharacterized protein RCO7_02749 [Rhynchosporium graminicola]|uniref:Cellulosomal protein n=1 Tax=Rhynchosporium graminicola TaxID=2792576 RepID=A0A1E1KT36_9HELO|nr:uncharacterized protein RCO7_02749 [Rhynchosporium commune]